MSVPHESGPDDDTLVRYLVGLLPDEEAERIDELSIADEDVAWRLRAVEDDLVDAYVQGTLIGEILERFTSSYLSSPRRREKVRFAESLLKAAAAPALEPAASSAAPVRGSRWYARLVPRSTPGWALAAAAVLLLVGGVALVLQAARLRHELREAQGQRAVLDRRVQDLERQLSEQRAARADAARQPAPSSRAFAPIALVLFPQTRAAGPIATLTAPPATDRVSFELHLEPNDFSRYQVALKDAATNRIVWRSDTLAARSAGETPSLAFIVSASVFKVQYYAFEVTGRGEDGRAEVIGSYPFRIARR